MKKYQFRILGVRLIGFLTAVSASASLVFALLASMSIENSMAQMAHYLIFFGISNVVLIAAVLYHQRLQRARRTHEIKGRLGFYGPVHDPRLDKGNNADKGNSMNGEPAPAPTKIRTWKHV